MKRKNIRRLVNSWLIVLAALCAQTSTVLAQNCTITGPTEGCVNAPNTFEVSTQPGETVSWTTSDNQTAPGGTAQFTFSNPGNVIITVKITTLGGAVCTQDLSFTVNDAPKAAFNLLSDPTQCYSGNYFEFEDISTPGSGRTLTNAEWVSGGISGSFTSSGSVFKLSYPQTAGGCYDGFLRVKNDKGCISDYQVPDVVCVTPDIGADFSTNATASCGKTTVPIQNTSSVPFNRVKKFIWDFGDGTKYTSGSDPSVDSCYWSPTHVYEDHGCFDVTLIVQDDSNCWDTMFKPGFACNINPQLIIEETNGKDAQCFTGNNFTFTHNIDPLNWPLFFAWSFDDPPSGNLNTDTRNFKNAPHSFTAPDMYTVSIQGTIAGCAFFSTIDVLVKGPQAIIDNKVIGDIVDDTLRHQCQIKDTVYFKNNSVFSFNDDWILDDRGGQVVLKENNMVLLTLNPTVKATENVIDVYVWGKDTMGVVELPLMNLSNTAFIKHNLVMFDNFFGAFGAQRQDDHTRTVWDFGDNTAPQCTTWTKYMQNVWDANGEWMNCNYSRDPKPKHWYTPGEEGCFTVTLRMTDTTFRGNDGINYPNGGVFNDTVRINAYMRLDSTFDFPPLVVSGDTDWVYSPYCANEKQDYNRDMTKPKFFTGFDTVLNRWYLNPNSRTGEECTSSSTIMLALEPPNAAGMIVQPAKSVFCLGSNPTYGVNFDWSGTTPSCTRQFVWMNFDSLADCLDNSPMVLDKWTPQSGFFLDPVTPWPNGTLSQPQFPNEIYYDYTGKLADSCGRITVGLRVQNGFDPYTKQPCIDEKWYHDMLNYVNSDPEFMLDTVYGCSPFEVELTFVREYHDSLDALMINANVDFTLDNDYNKGFTYIDSIYRDKYDPRTGQKVNYILTFYVDRTGIPKKVDSVVWSPGEGGLAGCESELKIKTKRKLTFREPGRYAIVATSRTKDGCDNTSSVHYLVVGHVKNIGQNKTLICKDEIVEFMDTSLYLLLEPDPVTGEQFIRYNYWRDGNRFKHPNGDPRIPTPFHETTKWDFGQGTGFTTLRFNPLSVSYKVPGHYIVKAEFIDSVGCKDTLSLEVDVTGGKSNFNFEVKIGNCKPIIDFVDSSYVYDPCRLTYGSGCDSVIRWIWDFGDGSPIINTTIDNPVAPPIINPSHVYQRFGDYDVKLVIETRMGCFDTLVRTISIAGPQPRFDFTIDSIGCAPYTVYLGNYTLDPSNNSSWTWHFGDDDKTRITTTSDTSVYFTYTKPGKYKLLLEQSDIVPLTGERCIDSFPGSPQIIEVTVLPEKKVDFIASKLEVCPNEIITFTDTSDTTYTTFIWDMGDGTILTLDKSQGGRQITHKYAAAGDYVVRLMPDYTPAPGEPKCKQWKSYLVKVRDVNASFTVDTMAAPLFKFKNTSTNFTQSWWRFGDGDEFTACPQVDPANCPNAQHNYGDNSGSFDVCLVVLSPEGCYDTACATVRNFFDVSIKVPNVFTPDNDGFNDDFVVEVENWTNYEIKIYNRFSEQVFGSTDPGTPWNGKKENTGADLPAGIYYVLITYQLRGEPEKQYKGTITLIRK